MSAGNDRPSTAGDARRAGTGLRRMLSSQLREQRRIVGIEPRAPISFLLARVGRWFVATLVPVDDARDFARELERVSGSDVRYGELPGAEHAFDLWPSVQTARIADAVGRFLTAVVEGAKPAGPRAGRGAATSGRVESV